MTEQLTLSLFFHTRKLLAIEGSLNNLLRVYPFSKYLPSDYYIGGTNIFSVKKES